jgi:hypothetical protein
MAEGLIRCPEDDPNRCQGATAFGQCDKLSVEGSDRCKIHQGSIARKNKEIVNGYMLTKWQSRLDRLADANGIRSLRSEIGMLKMTLEAVVGRCNTDDELIESSSKIMSLVEKIEKVVLSCNRLERTTGMMMDKTQALQIAGNICTIIGEHVSDADTIEAISEAIITQVLNVEFVE